MLALFGCSASNPSALHKHDELESGLVTVSTSGGESTSVSLAIESAVVEVSLPSGGTYLGHAMTVFDDRSGLYWWAFQGLSDGRPASRVEYVRNNYRFFVSDTEIAGVTLTSPPVSLWFKTSKQRAGSIEQARRRIVLQLERQAAAIEVGTASWLTPVEIRRALPARFFFDLDDASGALRATLRSLRKNGSEWEVELDGREQREARLRLTENFELVP